MNDPQPESRGHARGASPACLECQSTEVRPSRSTYPRDAEALAARAGSFWRCGNCGARFLGPPVLERKRRHHRHRRDRLDRTLDTMRASKRWVFPLLAILATILVVIYILDHRAPPRERLVLPGF